MSNLLELFDGFKGSYTTFNPDPKTWTKDESKPWKRRVPNFETTKKPWTWEMVDDHFNQKRPMGISPLREDGTCSWGCLDVDNKPEETDLNDFYSTFANFPSLISQTKSDGGLRVHVFAKEPVPAQLMQDAVKGLLSLLPKKYHDHTEVFPFQTSMEGIEYPKTVTLPMYGKNWFTPLRICKSEGQYWNLLHSDPEKPYTPEVILSIIKKHCLVDKTTLELWATFGVKETTKTKKPSKWKKSTEPAGRGDWLFKKGCSLRGKGGDDAAIKAELERLNKETKDGFFTAGPIDDKRLQQIIKSICKRYEPGKPIDDELIAINEQYFLLAMPGKGTRICRWKSELDWGNDRKTLFNQGKDSFLLENSFDAAAQKWLRWPGKVAYLQGTYFDPSTTESQNGGLNLWRGLAIEPSEGDCEIIVDHIRVVLAGGVTDCFDYIIKWMAWCVQNPDKHAETSLVFRGEKGVGKSIIGRWFCELFGQHAMHLSEGDQLSGKFNAHLRDCVWLFGDEVVWGGDKHNEGQLKRMVTERTLLIEGKGKDAEMAVNRLKIMLATNENWAVPSSVRERRWAIFDATNARQGDEAYFTALAGALDGDGGRAFLYHLQNMPLGKFHPRSGIPKTAARQEQIERGDKGEAGAIRRLLEEGQLPFTHEGFGEPNVVPFVILEAYMRANGARYANHKSIPLALKGIAARKREDQMFVGWTMGNPPKPIYERCVSYVFEKLKVARMAFDPEAAWDDQEDWACERSNEEPVKIFDKKTGMGKESLPPPQPKLVDANGQPLLDNGEEIPF